MTATITDQDGQQLIELPHRLLPSDATVYERVLQILAELPAIGKTKQNLQQKFMYRGHDDVLNALNPLLAEHGVFLVPRVLERETDQRTTKSGSIMYEVNLHVEYTFYGARGDSFVASAWGEGTDSGDKSTNKAMTMAFKNVLAQAFAISTAETIDTDASSPEETISRDKRAGRTAFDPGRDLLEGAIRGEDAGVRIAEALHAVDATVDWGQTLQPLIKAVFGVEDRANIPAERYGEFYVRLSNAVERMGDPSSFPSAGDDTIVQALAWAFEGVITIVVVNEEIQQADEALRAEAEAAAADGAPADAPFTDLPSAADEDIAFGEEATS